MKKPTLRLVPVKETEESDAVETAVGAGIEEEVSGLADVQEQIAAQAAAIAAAHNAAKAGQATPEQTELILALARQAVQATGVAADQLKTVDREVTLVTPTGIPIKVKVSDIGTALSDIGTALEGLSNVAALPGSAATSTVATSAKVLGWIGENPRLTLGLVAAGLGLWIAGPFIVPIVLGVARRR